jgi:hypothetical protein
MPNPVIVRGKPFIKAPLSVLNTPKLGLRIFEPATVATNPIIKRTLPKIRECILLLRRRMASATKPSAACG